jgi:hypothetical protein
MLQEKAGEVAGKIWNALNETEGLTQKQIKKVAIEIKLKELQIKKELMNQLLRVCQSK